MLGNTERLDSSSLPDEIAKMDYLDDISPNRGDVGRVFHCLRLWFEFATSTGQDAKVRVETLHQILLLA